MVFQEPMNSLHPIKTVGAQIIEAILLHQDTDKRAARERAVELIDRVGIAAPARRVDDYPGQMSGGMRQRVMIAMALSCNPRLLFADEPTTALDVTIQAQIVDLMLELHEAYGMSLVVITHNMGLVARMAQRVAVMYLGRIVELTDVHSVFKRPLHPYTQGLLRSMPLRGVTKSTALEAIEGTVPSPYGQRRGCSFAPRCPHAEPRCFTDEPPVTVTERGPPGGLLALRMSVLEVEGLTKLFPIHRGLLRRRVGDIRAVDDVSFAVAARETLGIVGESGSGKTTVARCLMRLVEPTSGSIRLAVDGSSWDVVALQRDELKAIKRHMQIVFQDPVSSLDPRMSVGDVIAEGLVLHGMKRRREREARVAELLDLVGMDPAVMRRYPHEFSGGQRQRIGIARALALGPRVLLCDEPVSALDVSIQAQVLNLFNRLQRELGLSYLFIAHDLTVVQYVSDRIAVMYLGRVVEVAPAAVLGEQPLHPYTEALLACDPPPRPGPGRAAGGQGRHPRPVVSAGRLPLPHPLPVRGGGVPATRAGAARTARGKPA